MLQQLIERGESVLANDGAGRLEWYFEAVAFVREVFGEAQGNLFAGAGHRSKTNVQAVQKQVAVLRGLLTGRESRAVNSENPILDVFDRFDATVRLMQSRRKDRPALVMADEYDVQYLLSGLLRNRFDDVVLENPVPKHGAKSSRVDIHLPSMRSWIEVKYVREGDNEAKIQAQLIEDFEMYRKGDLDLLYCFVYDPERVLRDARMLERDLSGARDKFENMVVVRP